MRNGNAIRLFKGYAFSECIAECEVQLSNQIKSLTQIEEECRNIWQGIAANAFVGKMYRLYRIVNKYSGDGCFTSTFVFMLTKSVYMVEESWCTAKEAKEQEYVKGERNSH